MPRPGVGLVVTLWVPVACFAALAWDRRWMSDDGFINLRVVWHVINGHGPVYNIGERVEAGTSPLWIAVIALARGPLFFLDPAWVAVLCGIALSLAGIALAVLGARRWWASLGREASLPAGVAVLVALPPMWDFASSGLETGLTFAWLGACWWATTRRLGAPPTPDGEAGGAGGGAPPERAGGAAPAPAGGDDRAAYDPWWVPVLVGLGPLVRPDLAGFSVAFAVAVAATSTRSRAGYARALATGLAAPVAYQVFRMGYFGLLVPNTALAKEAGRHLWARGSIYLDQYLDATLLRVSIGVLLLVFVVSLVGAGASSRHLVVAAAPIVGALVHTLYVVRVGGDFMYARLLLPATFAALCPLAALPRPAAQFRALWAPLAGVAACVVLVGGFRRWDADGRVVMMAMGDERAAWVDASGKANPVTLDDYRDVRYVELAERLPVRGRVTDPMAMQMAPSSRPVSAMGAIGAAGMQLMGTHVVDNWGLAEPVGSHMETELRVRAGHEKPLPWAWTVGRFGKPPLSDPDARAARETLHCGRVEELVEAVSDPLTPGRFLRNLTGAVGRTELRIPVDPQEARERFCPARRRA